MKPVKLALLDAENQILKDPSILVVVALGVHVESASAMGDFDKQFRRSSNVVLLRGARLAAVLWQNSQAKVGLRFAFLAQDGCCGVKYLHPRRATPV